MPISSPKAPTMMTPQAAGGSLKKHANFLSAEAVRVADPTQSRLWVQASGALRTAESRMDQLAAALTQPAPLGDPLQAFDFQGNLVVSIGNITDPRDNRNYPGIWTKSIWIGGAGPTTAPVVINDNGIATTLPINSQSGVSVTGTTSTGSTTSTTISSPGVSGSGSGPGGIQITYNGVTSINLTPVGSVYATGNVNATGFVESGTQGHLVANVLTSSTGVFGTPGSGQTNGTVVTGVTLTG